jgi:hypothetical protein
MESLFPSLRSAAFPLIGRLALAGLAGLAAMSVLLHVPSPVPGSPASARPNALVRWHDARHDWLLVADQASDEVVIYDATDGRPLRRLGRRQGLAGVEGLVRRGPWVFVFGRGRRDVRVLKLPQLQPVDLAAR